MYNVIGVVTGMVIIYLGMIAFNIPFPFVYTLFLAIHVGTIYMVYTILKAPYKSKKTFDQQWYDH
ncbi:hypothetical protein OO013_18495 [Mangrovivirga sp. M17]|uniref:Uncharacterized protein n=1 Tax=Mangrovivirga halotolerans TaxID=2993936 RepID=A0ABT3RW64_9BACT|nr:hypothetical protein [Mangrovivirga halotolerans]MCX2745878.1 hypothetical protein [Mangrovivirga halotolerans]